MDQNDKNNKNRRGTRNLLGAVKLVAWALVLTLVFYCTSSYMGSAGKQASNINIKYSDFIAMMEGKEPTERYNGYAACPIVTDYGHVLLCEFDYQKQPDITFPFTLIDTSKEQYLAWLLKVYILKPFFFNMMLNGLA